MKWIIKGLIGIVLVALLIFAMHWAYLYVIPKWAKISFYSYLALGVFSITAGLFWLRKITGDSGNLIGSFLGSFEKAKSKPSFLTKARNIGAFIVACLEGVLVWPPGVVKGLGPRFRKEVGQPGRFLRIVATQSNEHPNALFALGFILMAYALGYLHVTGHGYGKLFVGLMTASVVFRHIRYSLAIPGLPVTLRRTSGSPYLIFLIIVVADFLTLVLGFALLKNGKAPPDVNLQDFMSTTLGLYKGQEISYLLNGRHLSPIEIAIGTAGLLFYLALLQIALHFRDFRRTDEDYLWLAGQHIGLGAFTTALKYSTQVQSSVLEKNASQALSFLGVNQVEKAREKIAALSEDQRVGQPPALFMLELCAYAPVPENVVASVFLQAIQDKVPDVRFQDTIHVVVLANPAFAPEFEALLRPHQGDYPLTYARLLWLSGLQPAALDTLKMASPGSELEEIVRLTLRLIISLDSPESTQAQNSQVFRQWANSDLPVVRNLLTALAKPWEKLVVFGQLNLVLIDAEKFGKEREQEISFLLGELRCQIENDPQIAVHLKAMEIRLQNLRREKTDSSQPTR